jgi:hypothetical protein
MGLIPTVPPGLPVRSVWQKTVDPTIRYRGTDVMVATNISVEAARASILSAHLC